MQLAAQCVGHRLMDPRGRLLISVADLEYCEIGMVGADDLKSDRQFSGTAKTSRHRQRREAGLDEVGILDLVESTLRDFPERGAGATEDERRAGGGVA